MEKKSLDELRALARAAGLRGYSALRKKQLIEVLKKQKARSSAGTAKPRAAPKKTAKSTPARRGTRSAQPSAAKSPTPATSFADRFTTAEEHIESAKFEMGPPGVSVAHLPSVSPDLHEDIERLPVLNESVLCLLPQKPGVVHAYWSLQPGASQKNLRLRLCRATDNAIELLQEIKIAGERGHWYFQIPGSAEPGSFFAQLGNYDSAGAFVSAIRRGVARIPSLYASDRTDRRWSISEEEFRAMYLRAGGITRGGQLLWPGSFSSPQK